MLCLNDKMMEADKNFYFNSERVNVKQTSIKVINKLVKATKFNHVPLIVSTPYTSERFYAQLVPYQFQVAQLQQQQQQEQQHQQPEEQQLQLQLCYIFDDVTGI